MFFRKRSTDSSTPQAPASGPLRLSGTAGATPHPTQIGRNTRFRGQMRGRGPLVIRGHVQGKVEITESLSVESGGVLDAEVRASDVLIGGSVRGDLQALGTLAVRFTGILEGRIRARHLKVEEGAFLNGTISRGESGV